MVQVIQFYIDKVHGYYYPQIYEDGRAAPSSSTSSPGVDGNPGTPGDSTPSSATVENCALTGKSLQAVNWILNRSNWNGLTDSNQPGLDVSGSDTYLRGKNTSSAQCTDLCWAFVAYLENTLGSINGDSPAWNVEQGVSAVYGNYPSYGAWTTVYPQSLSDMRIGDVTRISNTHSEVVVKIDAVAGYIYYLTQNVNSPKINKVATPTVGPVKASAGYVTLVSRMPTKYL